LQSPLPTTGIQTVVVLYFRAGKFAKSHEFLDGGNSRLLALRLLPLNSTGDDVRRFFVTEHPKLRFRHQPAFTKIAEGSLQNKAALLHPFHQ